MSRLRGENVRAYVIWRAIRKPLYLCAHHTTINAEICEISLPAVIVCSAQELLSWIIPWIWKPCCPRAWSHGKYGESSSEIYPKHNVQRKYIMYMYIIRRNRDSSVDITTGYRLDGPVSIPGMARFSSSPQRTDRLCGPLSLLFNEYWGDFLVDRATGTWNSPLTFI
jgi:hypothetical protein